MRHRMTIFLMGRGLTEAIARNARILAELDRVLRQAAAG